MHLPRRLKAVGLAAALAVLSTTCSAADAKFYGWYPCSQWSLAEEVPLDNSTTPDIPDAECAVFKAPLCYDGVCTDKTNQQVYIFVKRYQKGDGAGKPNVIFMQGGPGASSAAMEDGMTSLYALLEENVNVYTMDHRGTGRSTLLDCVAAQAQTSGSPGGTGISPSEVANCAAELQSRYGSNLASFSVTSAASDLKNFITNYLKGTTYVYGVSYGTLLVERLMHLDTPNVGGYVLDGIATTSGASLSDGLYMSKWDLNMDAVGKSFMDRCADNSDECGKYFSASSLPSTLRTLISKFDSSYSFQPCSDFLIDEFKDLFQIQSLDTAGPIMRQFFGMLIKSMTMRKLIPVITYRVNRCSLEDQKVLSHFFDVYKQAYSTPSEEDQLSSSLLYGLIVYSELWESPPPSQTTIDTRFANTLIASYGASVKSYCAFTKDTSSVCSFSTANDYKAGAIAYKRDKYYNVAASPPKDVSVLLMSGKLDPQTPDQYAQTLLQALDTTNKAIVQFDYATHATLWTTPMASAKAPTCGMQILGSYVKNSGDLSKLDKSCIDKMPKFSFAMSKNAMAKWLNVTDAFDGDKLEGLAVYETDVSGDSSSSTSSSSSSTKSKYQAVFIAAAVAFGVALVVAIVFAIKWMRAKKANESSIKEVNVYTENTV